MYISEIEELTKAQLESIKEMYEVSEEQIETDIDNNLIQVFDSAKDYLDWMYLDDDASALVEAFVEGVPALELIRRDARCRLYGDKVIFYNE